MKKLLALLLVFAMALCFAGCGAKENETTEATQLTVYEDYALTAESYAYLIQKGNTEMQNSINELLAELKETGELEEIINSFFDGTADFFYENPTSKEGCLIVATNAYFPPFEYYEGNTLTGVDMKIASLLAEKLGKTLYILDEEFDSVFTSVQTGEADIGMAGITKNAKREETFDFSTEYYESAQVLMVKQGDTTFADCTSADDITAKLATLDVNFVVGTQKGTTGYMYTAGDEDFGYDGFKNITCKSYSNGSLAGKDLQNGAIDAVIIDKQPAIMIAESLNK